MKLALLLGLINPSIGGILLVGPRGTAKTTAVRSLLDILPKSRSKSLLLRLYLRRYRDGWNRCSLPGLR